MYCLIKMIVFTYSCVYSVCFKRNRYQECLYCCFLYCCQWMISLWQFSCTIRHDWSRMLDTSPTRHFAYWTLRLLRGQFAHSTWTRENENMWHTLCSKKTSRCLVVVGDHVIHLNFGGHNHKLRLSSSVIGGEMSCRRNVQVVGEVSCRRTVQ